MVSVIDEATGLIEIVEVSAIDEKSTVDTIIEDEPDAFEPQALHALIVGLADTKQASCHEYCMIADDVRYQLSALLRSRDSTR